MKTTLKKAHSNPSSSPSPVGGADPLPSAGAPVPPGDRVRVKPARGKAPSTSEVAHGSDAAGELSSTARYGAIFGEWAPDAQEVANALDFASQWYAEVVLAKAWLDYAKTQTVLAWQFVEPRLDLMRDPLRLAIERDPSVATELKSFVQVALGRSVRAARAHANKAARARDQKRTGKKKGGEAPAPEPATDSAKPAGSAAE